MKWKSHFYKHESSWTGCTYNVAEILETAKTPLGSLVELRSKVKLILVVMWEHLNKPRCHGNMNWHVNM